MASLLEYCKKLSDEQLVDVINEYVDSGDPFLVDTAVKIAELLVERYPSHSDPHAAWERFVRDYMPRENEDTSP